MKLKDIILEEYKNRYEKGDKVNTSLGNGVITQVTEPSEKDHNGHVMVHLDAEAQKKFELEDRPYKLGFSDIHKHI